MKKVTYAVTVEMPDDVDVKNVHLFASVKLQGNQFAALHVERRCAMDAEFAQWLAKETC